MISHCLHHSGGGASINATSKNGFYQYTAVYDVLIWVETGKKENPARVYFEFKEMMEGEHSL